MRIRLAAAVTTMDGPHGVVSGLVIDPAGPRLTHIVVGPDQRPLEPRLVPVELIGLAESTVSLTITRQRMTELPLAQFTGYVRYGREIEPGEGWAAGVHDVVYEPRMDADFNPEAIDHEVEVSYHRIPAGTSEICRTSEVVTGDGMLVGHAEAVTTVGDDRVHELIVRVGEARGITVAASSLERIDTDRVTLSIDAPAFAALPNTDIDWPSPVGKLLRRLVAALRRMIWR